MANCKEINVKFIFLLVLSFKIISACDFGVILKQNLLNEGFHRNMTYSISIVPFEQDKASSESYKDCYMSVHQPLPAGIYGNLDELDDLNRAHRLRAVTKKTNVELPTHLSEPSTAYIFEKMTGNLVQTWLPLHARYHKAAWFGGYVINRIENPLVYIRCPNNQLADCEETLVPYKFLCTIYSNDKCIWRKLPFIVSTESPVIWQTPIGDLNHYYPVAIATTMVVIMAAVYLLASINKAKCSLLDYDHID